MIEIESGRFDDVKSYSELVFSLSWQTDIEIALKILVIGRSSVSEIPVIGAFSA